MRMETYDADWRITATGNVSAEKVMWLAASCPHLDQARAPAMLATQDGAGQIFFPLQAEAAVASKFSQI